MLAHCPWAVKADNKWKKIAGKVSQPATLNVRTPPVMFSLAEAAMFSELKSAPADIDHAQIIALPFADGSLRDFRVWRSGLLSGGLAARYPDMGTYSAEAVGNANITAKIDITVYGLHAIIFDGNNISLVDPVEGSTAGVYAVHYKKDEQRAPENRMKCAVGTHIAPVTDKDMDVTQRVRSKFTNGTQLRSYRLALACNTQYAQAVTGLSNPTIAQTLSKMITSMNRINGIYERELAVTMTLVDNEDTLIWTAATGGVNGDDPFFDINTDGQSCIAINQMTCDRRIGNLNYDLGHVFTTGGGGLSNIGIVCQALEKAKSVTGQPSPAGDGFDLDYVAHEMGHEFGADHSFNNNIDGSCTGNYNDLIAYEPGSGSTIMAYAGICSPDDIQPHSDPYFHATSLKEIQSYLFGPGNSCALKVPSGNTAVTLPPFAATYSIPFLTPFELTAPDAVAAATDTSVTYCWEQWNLGDPGQRLVNTHYFGPIFRSFNPTKSPTRVFPNMDMVLADSLSNAGTEGAEGEKVPDVERFLSFKLTVRSVANGLGCFLIPDDSVHLDVVNTGRGFTVTTQNLAGDQYLADNPMNVKWDVVGTNAAPISCDSVTISLSLDGGHTWPFLLGNFPNTGTASPRLPSTDTLITNARIKVKGLNNVFFNVNRARFNIYPCDSALAGIHVFPSPARTNLKVYTGDQTARQYAVYDVAGRLVQKGEINGELDIRVQYWARGIYFIAVSGTGGQRTVRKFAVE